MKDNLGNTNSTKTTHALEEREATLKFYNGKRRGWRYNWEAYKQDVHDSKLESHLVMPSEA